MDFFPFVKVRMQLIFITIMLSVTTAGPFFGVDFSAPDKNIKTRGGEISQPNPWLSGSNSQRPNSPFGSTNTHLHPHSAFGNPFPRAVNSNINPGGDYFNPSPMEFIDTVKTVPEKSIELISTLTQELNDNSNDEKPSPEGAEEVTLGWSETGSDYTTETSEYETTTDEPLNRIGGPAPAVVASLLG